MIKYEIVGKFPDSALIDACISLLATQNIMELPILPEGEKKVLFDDDTTRISFTSKGKRIGFFSFRQIFGDITTFWTSTDFKY